MFYYEQYSASDHHDHAVIHLSKKIYKHGLTIDGILLPDQETPKTAIKIFEVYGITGVNFVQYRIELRKDRTFNWRDVMPKIIDILAKLDPKEGMIEQSEEIVWKNIQES